MTDQEIMSLPDWNEALNELIDELINKQQTQISEEQLGDLIKILINRYREFGYLIKPHQTEQKKGYGMGMCN